MSDVIIRTRVADTQTDFEAAVFADMCQGAVNLRAISARFVEKLDDLRAAGICGDDLNNHPAVLTFVSKLISLTRFTPEREAAAFAAVDDLQRAKSATYEVIEIKR